MIGFREAFTRGQPSEKNYTVNAEFDASIKYDGYEMKISGANINIRYNGRGLTYSKYALDEMSRNGMTDGIYADYPDFALRGVIEGFYGAPYSHKTRLNIIDTCREYRLNSYFYAPKDDLFHREKWREPYSPEMLDMFKELIHYADKNEVDFYFCISPGKDFGYCNDDDYKLLYAKIDSLTASGAKCYAILFDDIDNKLKGADKKAFSNPGKAHAYLANAVKNHIGNKALVICPTEYFQLLDSPYRKNLRKNLDKEISVFWTGYNTVPEVITSAQGKEVSVQLGNNTLLWENYPVNDFGSKNRLYLGALKNRGRNLYKYMRGVVVNPMPQWYASKIALSTISDYMWNSAKYEPEDSLKMSAEKIFGKGYSAEGMVVIEANSATVMDIAPDLKIKTLFELRDFVSLGQYYEKNKNAAQKLLNHPDKNLIADLMPVLKYMISEYSVFNSLPAPCEKEVLTLSESPYRTNGCLLSYIKENKLINNYEKISLNIERENYWKI